MRASVLHPNLIIPQNLGHQLVCPHPPKQFGNNETSMVEIRYYSEFWVETSDHREE